MGFPHIPPEKGGKQNTPKDFIVEPITLRKGLTGAKPPKVCMWILDLLGFRPGDTCDDLYPGTGIMGSVISDVSFVDPTVEYVLPDCGGGDTGGSTT
jgi:hypothetical protein